MLPDSEFNRQSQLEQSLKYNRKILDDERYGDLKILKNPQNGLLFMKREKISNTQAMITKEIYSSKTQIKLTHPNLIQLIDYSTSKQEDWCSIFYKIQNFYEFEPNDMQREIKERVTQGIGFNNEEMTYQLYNMVDACAYQQQNGINVII